MDDRYQYLLLMGGCLLLTLPLEFALRARVCRRCGRRLGCRPPMRRVFRVWDWVGVVRGHWTYSPRFTTGILLPFGIPVEEFVFFLVVPICGLLTYEAVGTVLGRVRGSRARQSRVAGLGEWPGERTGDA